MKQPVENGATESGPTARVSGRIAVHVLWIVALSVALVLGVERFGFNPTDQGFVLSQSWRILNGEIPHLDVISARPLGSAYLHTLDVVLPGPMYLVSVAIATLQMVVMTVVLAAWIADQPVTQWTAARTMLVAAAALVNIHLFPLNPWHTIDGLFLVVCGWWALDLGLRTDRTVVYRFGLLLLGFASITKQSFVPAVIAGLVVLCVHPAVRNGVRPVRLAIDIGVLAAVPLVYLAGVSAAGGFGDMYSQLTGGVAATGRRLIEPGVSTSVVAVVAVFAVVVIAIALVPSALRRSWASRILLCAAAALLVLVVAEGRLERAGTWGVVLFWMLACSVVVDAVVRRSMPWRTMGLLLLAWMASLSWGYDSPTLLGGSMALATVELVSRHTTMPEGTWFRRAAAPCSALVVLVSAAGFLVVEQARSPYRDRPRSELVAGLGAAIPEMRGIESTPSTLAYLDQMRTCVQEYPADNVAVLPDNSFVYPVLKARNPFPMDWLLPLELIADSRARIAEESERLQQNGSYLVLFATVTPEQLAEGQPVPDAVPTTAPIADPTGVLNDIRSRLRGQPVACGSFVGVWAPAAVTS